jgi:hypothetical protein
MMMKRMKAAGITSEDKMNELAYILASSFMGGLIGSGLSNGFEVVAVQKQADSSIKVMDIVHKERFNLLKKGIIPRMIYHSQQSMFLFMCVHYIGKAFDVDITELC